MPRMFKISIISLLFISSCINVEKRNYFDEVIIEQTVSYSNDFGFCVQSNGYYNNQRISFIDYIVNTDSIPYIKNSHKHAIDSITNILKKYDN